MLKRLYYFGFSYKCICCNARLRTYVEVGQDSPAIDNYFIIGAGKRKSCCPICISYDRDRLMYMYLFWHTDILNFKATNPTKDKTKLLHIAPETHLTNRIIKSAHIEYTAGDKFEPGYTYPSYCVALDITQLQYQDNHFDWIICNHVLEHILEDIQAMSELFRVLKPGGIAILNVPISYTIAHTIEDKEITDPEERLIHFGQRDHVRVYGIDYFSRLESVGFTTERISPQSLGIDINYHKLNAQEDLFIARKKLQ